MAFEYVINTLPVDRERVLHLHEEHPAIAAKERFQRELIERIVAEELDLSTAEGKRALLQNLVGQFVVLEGIFFYSGFALALAFRQRGLMRGLCTIIDWVLRDESLHLAFGTLLIHEYLREQKEAATEEAMSSARELIIKAVALEEAYNLAVLPRQMSPVGARVYPPHEGPAVAVVFSLTVPNPYPDPLRVVLVGYCPALRQPDNSYGGPV
jgi:ribonucleoside-diphosphate reductase beta chain